MASIGGIALTSFGAILPAYSKGDSRIFAKPGADGLGVLYDAWRTSPIVVPCKIVTTAASVKSIRADVHALENTSGTLIDQFGQVYANTFFKEIFTRPMAQAQGTYVIMITAEVLLDLPRPSSAQ